MKNKNNWAVLIVILILVAAGSIYFIMRNNNKDSVDISDLNTDLIATIEATTNEISAKVKEAFPDTEFSESSQLDEYKMVGKSEGLDIGIVMTKVGEYVSTNRIYIGYTNEADKDKLIEIEKKFIDAAIIPTANSEGKDKDKVISLTESILQAINDNKFETGTVAVRTTFDEDTLVISRAEKENVENKFYEPVSPYYLELWLNYLPLGDYVIDEGYFNQVINNDMATPRE